MQADLFDVAEAIFQHAEKMEAIGKPNAAAACRLLGMTFEDKARNGGAIVPPSEKRIADDYYLKRRAEHADAALERAVEAVRIFYGCAYPVSTEINPRGWDWRGESSLDEALGFARAVLAENGSPAVAISANGPSTPE